ncbi:TonB-dependent receptor [Hyphomonas sp.]|uniref:TonB-dependent receptor n=1 Tax=Hyphomonas sp. TaxID=87 RepID=UPI0035627C58
MSRTPSFSTILRGGAATFALSVGALGLAAPAFAQDADAATDKEARQETIIVTATKRAEDLQDVPISITAISGAQLVERGITDVLSLDKTIPGLVIKNSGNDPVPILRGAGAAGTTDTAVPIYVDSTYRPRAGQALASYLDLERVEVVRGPQGTLFGRNTLGGLINVISRKPETKAFDWGGAATFGDYALQRYEGFVNVPLGDKVAFRLTGSDTQRDPYVENTFNPDAGLKDADESYARAQLLWEASDDLSVKLGYTYWTDTANGNADYAYKVLGIPVNPLTRETNGVFGFIDPRQGTRDGWPGGRSQAGNVSNGDLSAFVSPNPYQVAFDYQPQRDIEETSLLLNVEWSVLNHDVTFNAATFDYTELRLTDTDLSSNSSLVAGQRTVSKADQMDININSAYDSKLQYTLGAYYYDDSDPGDSNGAFLWGYTSATSPNDPAWAYWLYQTNGGTKSTALYGQAEYSFTEKLRGTLGARYSKDERNSFTLGVDQTSLNDPLPSYTGSPTPIRGEDEHTDWRVGLDYDLTDDVMVYGYWATGYIAGGIQQGNTGVLLDPNEVETFEAGVKSMLLDGRLRFNGAYYNSKYKNLTTTVFIQQGGTILAQSVPGGSIVSEGMEFDISYSANDKLQLDVGIAMDWSEFDEFNVGNQFTEGGDTVIGGQSFFIMDGKDTRFSPDLAVSLAASYMVDLGEYGELLPSVLMKYSDEYQASNAPYFWSQQPSYTTFDLAATWSAPNAPYKVRVFANNVTEQLYLTEATVFSRSRAIVDYNAPRTWGVRISRNF